MPAPWWAGSGAPLAPSGSDGGAPYAPANYSALSVRGLEGPAPVAPMPPTIGAPMPPTAPPRSGGAVAPLAPTNGPAHQQLPNFGYTWGQVVPGQLDVMGGSRLGAPGAPAAPGAPGAPMAPSDGAGMVRVVDPKTGQVSLLTPEEARLKSEQNARDSDEERRRQLELERVAAQDAETRRIAADAQRIYNEAMVQTNNDRLAQEKADAYMRNELLRMQTTLDAQYKQQLLALQRQQMLQARRGRPFLRTARRVF